MTLEPISEEEQKRIHLEQPRIAAKDICELFDWEHIPSGRAGWLEVFRKLFFVERSTITLALLGGDVTKSDIQRLKKEAKAIPSKTHPLKK